MCFGTLAEDGRVMRPLPEIDPAGVSRQYRWIAGNLYSMNIAEFPRHRDRDMPEI